MTSEGKESDAIELTLKANHKSLIAAPNNLKQMTEEEYDAWIQKVTDSIAGRILLRKVDPWVCQAFTSFTNLLFIITPNSNLMALKTQLSFQHSFLTLNSPSKA
jgi:hypothetical protein